MNWHSGQVTQDDVLRNALLCEVDCEAVDEDPGVVVGMNADNLVDVLAVYGMLPGIEYVITDSAAILHAYAGVSRLNFILLGLGNFTGVVRSAICTNWAILAPASVREFWITRMDYQNLGVDEAPSQFRSFQRSCCVGFVHMYGLGRTAGQKLSGLLWACIVG